MKNQINKKCEVYGWNEENIEISDVMAGHVCHHIRNPLAIIAGVMQGMDPKDAQMVMNAVDRIVDYTQFLEDLSKNKV